MNRWSALALLLAVAGALALRVPKLDSRPFHNDEAVNAIKVTELWQHGRYVYDPDEYHGPTLHYATLPFLWLSGAHNPGELHDATLRLAPVACGVGLILLLLLFADGLGSGALIWSAIFLAASPAMVFYSRYFIHEMLFVFFTALTLGAGWRYVQTRRAFSLAPQRGEGRGEGWENNDALSNESAARPNHPSPSIPLPVEGRGKPELWSVICGASIGLMFATKETFVLNFAAMVIAFVATALWNRRRATLSSNPQSAIRDPQFSKHGALAISAALVIWFLFFSSFFTNFAGLADSVRTYLPWLKRAGGSSPHIHPWNFYFERLAWFHPAKGFVWSEGLILVLGIVGAIVSLVGNKSPLLRFLTLYTIVLTAIYSAISYKTPWCLLNFWFGMILLAGVGAAALIRFFRIIVLKTIVIVILLALVFFPLHRWHALEIGSGLYPDSLAVQAWRASFLYASDRRNPYVYAQTVPDLLNLVQRAEGLAHVAPTGYDTVIKVIAPESDYWPLPWYLRRFQHVGWYAKLPDDPFAPIIIVSSKLDARLDEKSDKKWIMAGLTELRPGNFFELYVELELWKKYVATLARQRE